MISVQNLFHSYTHDSRYALNNLSFEVAEGEIFGFLGPSGSGKSTTQNVITGLLPLQRGQVEVAGYDMQQPNLAMYNQIGVCFEQPNLYGKLTAVENLAFFASLFDVPVRDPLELVRLVGLEDAAHKRCAEFSKGMRQRINFARSMINNPKLWFLDEPTSGLDPAIAEIIKEIIWQRRREGTTVFLTTHNMFIADELCDRVAFIVDGEIKLIDSPAELKLRFGQNMIHVEYVQEGQIQRGVFDLTFKQDKSALAELISSCPIRTMHSAEATLEQIFIQVTGKELHGDEADAEPQA